jgi:hypothetical protein
MKVKELIKLLQETDQEREVIMSKDSEGNCYSPLYALWTGSYKPETTWYGEVGLDSLTEEDIRRGYTEEDVMKDGQSAIILCPTN